MPYMTGRSGTVLIDRRLRGVPLTDMLDARETLANHGRPPPRPDTRADLPILPTGATLTPGTLYESRHNTQLRSYVPDYRIGGATDGPAVELTFLGDQAEAGRLAITLTWTAPAPDGDDIQVKVMDHVADLELVHHVAVRGPDDTVTGSVPETVPLQPVVISGTGTATSTTTFADRASFHAVYSAMRNAESRAELVVAISAAVLVRTWNQVHLHRPELEDLQFHLAREDVMIANLVDDGSTSAVTAKAVLDTDPVRVKVRRPRTDASAATPQRLRVSRPTGTPDPTRGGTTVRAVRARRTVAGVPAVANPIQPAVTIGRRDAATARARGTRAQGDPVAVTRPRPANLGRPQDLLTSFVASPSVIGAVAGFAAPPDQPVASPAEPPRTVSSTLAASLVQSSLRAVFLPSLRKAITASELVVDSRPAIPVRVAIDRKGRPALVEMDLEARHHIPFVFPPAEYGEVYRGDADGDGDEDGVLRFLRQRVVHREGKDPIVVLQDSVLEDVIHLPPTQFRLGRDRTSPYLPRMGFVLSETTTTDDDVDAEVMFRAAVVYELEPWTDPEIVRAVTADLAQSGIVPTFTVVAPTSITYDLDGEPRADAQVDPLVGIRDVLELDAAGFAELTGRHLAGSGLTGTVSFELFDGSTAQADVRLSFIETSPDLVDVLFAGRAEGEQTCLVTVRNRVESPITIMSVPEVIVTADVRATPLDLGSVIGRQLAPMESVEVRYRLDDPAVVLTTFSPAVLARPVPDVQRLCASLIEGPPGYDSLVFPIRVSAAGGLFDATPDSATQLVGVLVEFDDGSVVTLTPEDPEVEVTLIGRLLDQVFASDDDEREERYFYRVTNLHLDGEGARSAWQAAQGTAPLTVGLAVGGLTDLPF